MSWIAFGRINTKNYGLIVAPYEIPMPPAKTDYVEVPGRDGSLDMTEALGTVRYGDRVINITMYAVGSYRSRLFEFVNLLHGQRMYIVFDKDIGYTYNGRIDVNGITKQDGYCEISVTVTAEPYKLEENDTTVTVSGSGRAYLVNGKMPVVPTVKTTEETSLTFASNGQNITVTLSAGEHIIPQLYLASNDSKRVTIASFGTTTFSFKKGWL